MVAQLSTLSKTAKHSFVPCNATLLKSATQFSESFAKQHSHLDFLVLTQGIATMQGRTETVEGLDEKMSLHYYSRMAFIAKLLPFMTGDDPRGKKRRYIFLVDFLMSISDLFCFFILIFRRLSLS